MERAVAVIGSGVMGHGIAQLFAQAGAAVRLHDTAPNRLAGGFAAMDESLALLVEEAVLSAEEATAARDRVLPTTDLDEALAGADLVVEAIPELLEAKLDLFDRIERAVGDDTLVTSNTSTLPISRLAARARRPERMAIDSHFFNPAQLIPLVEVLPHPRMPPAAVERVLAALRRIGKRPVLLRREVPGFVAEPARGGRGPRGLPPGRAGRGQPGGHRRRRHRGAGLPLVLHRPGRAGPFGRARHLAAPHGQPGARAVTRRPGAGRPSARASTAATWGPRPAAASSITAAARWRRGSGSATASWSGWRG